MTFDEWLVREHGCNHGWTFSEVDAARKAWDASAEIEREACALACGTRRIAAECVEGEWDRGYNAALQDCSVAIRAR